MEALGCPVDGPGLDVDLAGGVTVTAAAGPGDVAQSAGAIVFALPVGQSAAGVVEVTLAGGDGVLGFVEFAGDVGRPASQIVAVGVLLGPHLAFVTVGVVAGGERFRLGSGQGGGDLFGRGGMGLDQLSAV